MKRHAIGIDFSGARDAGRKIWIARGTIGPRHRLVLKKCQSACELLNCGPSRDIVLPALAKWIGDQEDAVIGCDFPFSLPSSAIRGASWHDFVRTFAKRHPAPHDFRAAMRQRHVDAAQREPKRVTDLPENAATPWNPWNIRLYRQTHAGIGCLLSTLLGRASIAPFDRPAVGRPLIVETCPASSLKALGLYRKLGGYKGKTPASRRKRLQLLGALVDDGFVSVPEELRRRIVGDKGGDALDSVIAAIGAAAALPQIDAGIGYDQPIEGWVYHAGGGAPRG